MSAIINSLSVWKSRLRLWNTVWNKHGFIGYCGRDVILCSLCICMGWEEGHLFSSEVKDLLHVTELVKQPWWVLSGMWSLIVHMILEHQAEVPSWSLTSALLRMVRRGWLVPGTLRKAVAILVTKAAVLVMVYVLKAFGNRQTALFSKFILSFPGPPQQLCTDGLCEQPCLPMFTHFSLLTP